MHGSRAAQRMRRRAVRLSTVDGRSTDLSMYALPSAATYASDDSIQVNCYGP